MSTLALIPARGGSKGIPQKNLQLVGGVPLIGRSVKAAASSSLVDRVVVSTDDPLIAEVAQQYGAETINRPAEISTDTSSSESALLHALEELEACSRLVFLQCTSPFTTGKHIDMVLRALDPPNINSAFSAVPWHGFLWSLDGQGINHDHFRPRKRRQELASVVLETGAIYAMDVEAFLMDRTRFCLPTKPVLVNDYSPEIDTLHDLESCNRFAAISKL